MNQRTTSHLDACRRCLPALAVLVALMALPAANAQENWQQMHRIPTPEGSLRHGFGYAVAMNQDWMVIGAASANVRGEESGATYVGDPGAGQLLYRLIPSDLAEGDRFGHTIALSGDMAIIGAPFDDDLGSDSGAVYVFDLSTREQLFKLTEPGGGSSNLFGRSVAAEGSLLLVGVQNGNGLGENTGLAYVYDLLSGEVVGRLIADDGEYGDQFGEAVAVDGTIAIIGASGDDDLGSGAGAAYLFDLSTGLRLHKLHADDGEARDDFGSSVAIWGGRAVVGAINEDENGPDKGAAYVFDTATGEQLLKITPSNPRDGVWFGRSVAVDESRIAVGWTGYRQYSGAVYMFDATTGEEIAHLYPQPARASSRFGSAIALRHNLIAVGAPTQNTIHGDGTGVAYLVEHRSILEIPSSPLIGGQPFRVNVSFAKPNKRLWFVYSTQGLGHAYIPPLNVTIELAHPRLGASAVANANGSCSRLYTLPGVSHSRGVDFQVIQEDLRSNVVRRRIDPQ